MELKYYNQAGRRFTLPERPLEPPDCWAEGRTEVGASIEEEEE